MIRPVRFAAIAAVSLLAAATPVSAGHHKHKYKHHGHYHRPHLPAYPHYHPRPRYWAPPPVVVYPPRFYPPPPPVYVYEPPPVIVVPRGAPRYHAWQGSYCREWNGTAIIDGWRQRIWGTACLMPDGSWQLVD